MDATLIRWLLHEAVQLQLAGQASHAEQRLRAVVQAAPHTADAWHLLGVLALQRGDFTKASELIQQAIGCRPNIADFHYNLAGALYSLEQWEEAAASYRRATDLDANLAEGWKGLGASLLRQGQFAGSAAALQRSLSLQPQQPEVWLQLSDALDQLGRRADAIAAAKQTLVHDPYCADAHRRLASLFAAGNDRRNQTTAYYNLGESLRRQKKPGEAVAALEKALHLNPAHGKAAHSLACLTGRTPRAAPRDYVVDLFDHYASHFEDHLEKLDYRVPELLRVAVGRLLPPGAVAGRVLDLGCGTGKCGALFRDLATELCGLDLAPRMIEAAKQRNVYEALWIGDAREVSRRDAGQFDLILAADVFIYVGALEEVFAEAARISRADACFAFSVELCDGDGFVLRESGRYAHAPAYLKRLAARSGFAVGIEEAVPIRLQEGVPIPGAIYVLRKNASAQSWATQT
jgi:predicted TPR repeat methyltransferase